MIPKLAFSAYLVAVPLVLPLQLAAQDGAAPEQAGVGLPVPESSEAALEIELEELEGRLTGRPAEELAALLEAWSGFIEEEEQRFEAAYGRTVPEGERSAAVIAADRDLLIQRGEIIASLLEEAGGDPASFEALRTSIRQAAVDRADTTVMLEVGLAETVSVEAVKAFVRPLTKAQVEAQLARWLELLQVKCLQVRNAEIAALNSDGEREAVYYDRALVLRAERADLIERLNVVIDSLEAKGGDVTEARAYVESVVEIPSITGFKALMAMARSWLLSKEGGLALVLALAKALAAVGVAWLVGILLGRLAERTLRGVKNVSGLLREFVIMAVRRVTIFLGFLVGLAVLGVDMGPMMAAIGAAGLVVGLALQGTLSNFASGILIMINRPFDVGDLVSTSGTLGHVRGMTLITTRVETLDNQIIYVPNNMIWNDVITNLTAQKTRRVDLVFGISYTDDIRKAQSVLKEIVDANPKVLDDPEPNIRVHELGDSSVNFIVRPWVKTDDYWDVYWDMTEAVKERFDAEGISIPFPQRDVHHYYDGAGSEALAEKELRPQAGEEPAKRP